MTAYTIVDLGTAFLMGVLFTLVVVVWYFGRPPTKPRG